jgi:hypothetical protein
MAEQRFTRRGRVTASTLNNMQDDTGRNRLFFDETTSGANTTLGQGDFDSPSCVGAPGVSTQIRRWYKWESDQPVKGITEKGTVNYDYLQQQTPPWDDTTFERRAFADWLPFLSFEGTTAVMSYVQVCTKGLSPV